MKKCLDNYKNQVFEKAKQNEGDELFNLVFRKMKKRPKEGATSKAEQASCEAKELSESYQFLYDFRKKETNKMIDVLGKAYEKNPKKFS